MTTQAERLQIATTIVKQLGGNKFIAMTGAKNFISHDGLIGPGVTFAIPRANGINRIKIELAANDTYTMIFCYQHGMKFKEVDRISDAYFEDLQPIFTSKTGLYTSL